MPRPHPKFSLQDLQRISAQGPSYHDIVLQHAERLPQEADAAEGYNYVPFTVLGDYTQEQEPNWLRLPQMNLFEFYQGKELFLGDGAQALLSSTWVVLLAHASCLRFLCLIALPFLHFCLY